MPNLFDPVSYGAIKPPSRIVMAPLTRLRAERDHVPTQIMGRPFATYVDVAILAQDRSRWCRCGYCPSRRRLDMHFSNPVETCQLS
jgi:hypothetical protein